MDLITDAIDTAPHHLKHHLQVMAALDNVPRKEKQFRNFTANSLIDLRGKRNANETISEIWNYLKGLRKTQQAAKKAQNVPAAIEKTNNNSTSKDEQAKGSSGGGDSASSGEAVRTEDTTTVLEKKTVADKKSVKKAMKKVLKKASNRSLTVKALRKSVRSHLDAPKGSRDLVKELVQQNLNASTTFLVQGKTVSLKLD